jgi:hypothetical protein
MRHAASMATDPGNFVGWSLLRTAIVSILAGTRVGRDGSGSGKVLTGFSEGLGCECPKKRPYLGVTPE